MELGSDTDVAQKAAVKNHFPGHKACPTNEFHINTSIASSQSSKSRHRKPSTPNKLKHSSPIKKPPTTKSYQDYKENNSKISNLSSRILAASECKEYGRGKSSLKLSHQSDNKELNESAM